MAKSKESFNRRERERMKRQKADAKRERRLTNDELVPGSEGDAPPPVIVDESAIIQQLADLNATFEMGDLGFEDFDKRRSQLLSQLAVV
jgi:hypothetical protein